MRIVPGLMLIVLAGTLPGTLPGALRAADGFRGPTVVIAPGDITPLRGNIRNPLGPSQVYEPLRPLPRPSVDALERDLERDLDRLQSRSATAPLGPDPRAAPRDLLAEPRGRSAPPDPRDVTDRARARAALEAFKTLRPNAPATSGLERALDRIERPTDLGQ